MKKHLVILTVIFSIFALKAETKLDKKRIAEIGVVTLNMDEVKDKAKIYQDVIQQIQNKSMELNKKAQDKGSELEKQFLELRKLEQTLSEKSYNKKTEEFAVKEAEVKRSLSIDQNKIINARETAFRDVNKTTEEIVKTMAEEYNFDIVIPVENTLFDTDKIDISYELIDRLNKKVTSYKVKFE